MIKQTSLKVKILFLVFVFTALACNMFAVNKNETWESTIASGGFRFEGQAIRTLSDGCTDNLGSASLTLDPPLGPGEKTPVIFNALYTGSYSINCEVRNPDEKFNYPGWGLYDSQTGSIEFTACASRANGTAKGEAKLDAPSIRQSKFSGSFECYDEDGGFLYKIEFSADYVVE